MAVASFLAIHMLAMIPQLFKKTALLMGGQKNSLRKG
jgi:hypothetical protein